MSLTWPFWRRITGLGFQFPSLWRQPATWPRFWSRTRPPSLSSSQRKKILPRWCPPSPRSSQCHPTTAGPTPRLPSLDANPACRPAGRRRFCRVGVRRHRGRHSATRRQPDQHRDYRVWHANPVCRPVGRRKFCRVGVRRHRGRHSANRRQPDQHRGYRVGTPSLPVGQPVEEDSAALVSAVSEVVAEPPGESQTNTAVTEVGTPSLPVGQPVEEDSTALVSAVSKVVAVPTDNSQIGIIVTAMDVSVPAVDNASDSTATETSTTVRPTAIAGRLSATEMVLPVSRKAVGVPSGLRPIAAPALGRCRRGKTYAGPVLSLAIGQTPIWERPN